MSTGAKVAIGVAVGMGALAAIAAGAVFVAAGSTIVRVGKKLDDELDEALDKDSST